MEVYNKQSITRHHKLHNQYGSCNRCKERFAEVLEQSMTKMTKYDKWIKQKLYFGCLDFGIIEAKR